MVWVYYVGGSLLPKSHVAEYEGPTNDIPMKAKCVWSCEAIQLRYCQSSASIRLQTDSRCLLAWSSATLPNNEQGM
jgi:hypothetical protein